MTSIPCLSLVENNHNASTFLVLLNSSKDCLGLEARQKSTLDYKIILVMFYKFSHVNEQILLVGLFQSFKR